MVQDRTLFFDNIVNARHLGGLSTTEGRKVKDNVLLRTGNLSKASEEDLKRLKNEFKLKRVFDLRTTSEISFAQDLEVDGAQNVWINIFGTEVPGGGDPAKARDISVIDEKMIRDTMPLVRSGFLDGKMQLLYNAIAMSEASKKGYARMFEDILSLDGGAILWHCSQGKDRAGFAAVLILSALGVDRKTALDDYEMSNDGYAEQLEIAKQIIEEEQLDEIKIGVLKAMIGVNRDYMETIWDMIDDEYGSMRNYLRDEMNLTDEKIEKLKSWYLV